MRLALGTWVVALAFVLGPSAASASAGGQQDQAKPLRGVGIEETLDSPPILAPALDAARLVKAGLPLFVRLVVKAADLTEAPGRDTFARLDARVNLYAGRGIPVFVVLDQVPQTPDETDAWRQRLRAIAERYRGKVKGYQIGVAGAVPVQPAQYAFLIKLASVQIRSVDSGVAIAVPDVTGGDASALEQLYAQDVAAYVDVIELPAGDLPAARLSAIETLVQQRDPSAVLMRTGTPLGSDPPAAARRLVDSELTRLGTDVAYASYRASGPALQSALTRVAALSDLLAAEIVPLDEQATALTIRQAGIETIDTIDKTHAVRHRLLFNLNTSGTLIVYWGGAGASGVVDLELTDASNRIPVVRNPLTGTVEAIKDPVRDEATRRVSLRVPLAAGPLILDFTFGEANTFALREEATAGITLGVAEIIARHQQAQAAQDRLLRHYVASARMAQHFRPSGIDSGFDVVSENRFYFDRDGMEFEELSFSINGQKFGSDRPAFPVLQPEKVLSLPLDLRLTSDYRYRLEGLETVGEYPCYVVRFDPVEEGRSLYKGKVWIDRVSFVRIKVHALQTQLAPPVISNDEIQTFAPVADVDGHKLFLFTHLTSRQIFLIAGRTLPVEKEVQFSDFEVNGDTFVEARTTARSSDRIMYRDTDQGLRHYVKRGNERVVSERMTSSAKALAMGTIIDPSLDFPLPIFGINYLDFDFIRRDTQLALLFGGVLALGNVQAPKLAGTALDASVDFFAMAVPVLDQEFDASGARSSERVRNIPFSTGVNLGWQATDFQKIGGSYQFRYDLYFADTDTAPGFVAPSDTLTHGAGLTYEYKRAGYSFSTAAWQHRRTRWLPWGDLTRFDPRTRTYRKYSASLSKDFYLGPLQKIHFNGAYFGGQRLDRFSMYQFGLFDDTRMHGVPSAGLRFADLAVARGSYSFNVFEQYRLDVFLDQGYGRDLIDRDRWLRVTGLGVAVNFRGPRQTMIRTDFGKSFLPSRFAGSGSATFQIMVLKPL